MAAIELTDRLQLLGGIGTEQGAQAPGLSRAAWGQRAGLALELRQPGRRDDESAERPGVGACPMLGVLADRGRHVEARGGEKTGVVDSRGEEGAEDRVRHRRAI